jgi:hypothetical protein
MTAVGAVRRLHAAAFDSAPARVAGRSWLAQPPISFLRASPLVSASPLLMRVRNRSAGHPLRSVARSRWSAAADPVLTSPGSATSHSKSCYELFELYG